LRTVEHTFAPSRLRARAGRTQLQLAPLSKEVVPFPLPDLSATSKALAGGRSDLSAVSRALATGSAKWPSDSGHKLNANVDSGHRVGADARRSADI
jgi:hypothetical protein